MSVAQLKSKPEQGVFYRLRFNELPTINRSTLGHYWIEMNGHDLTDAEFMRHRMRS
jgi:hypothetical protein